MKRLHVTLRANVSIRVTAVCNDAYNVAEVGSISTFGTLQETLHATAAKPVTRNNSVVACNVACNISSCDSAFAKRVFSVKIQCTNVTLARKL